MSDRLDNAATHALEMLIQEPENCLVLYETDEGVIDIRFTDEPVCPICHSTMEDFDPDLMDADPGEPDPKYYCGGCGSTMDVRLKNGSKEPQESEG